MTLNSAFLRPRARGSVTLKSNNPQEAPNIDPNYWGHEYDVAQSIKGFRLTRKIMQQDAFKPFIKGEADPGSDVQSDDEIKDYAFRHAKTDYHPVGSCKMGSESDPNTVVNSLLKLKGIDGLRVCDSSVMPFLVSSNTNAPTIMIAEKAADMVRESHGL